MVHDSKGLDNYSQGFRKQTPKLSNPGGRLQEVVAYESLDHIGIFLQ